MKVYGIIVNNELMPDVYVSLMALCKQYDIGYSNVAHGKRLFYKASVKYEIKTLTLNKIKGRGNTNRFGL